MKRCNTCSQEKPLAAFGTRKGARDGHAGWCFDCAREYHARYRKENPDLIRAIQKRSREKNHEQYLAYQRYATQMRKQSLGNVAPRGRVE